MTHGKIHGVYEYKQIFFTLLTHEAHLMHSRINTNRFCKSDKLKIT